MSLRLQKFLAHAGFCSRRKAEDYIKAGRVRVDGQVVVEPWFAVEPGAEVRVDGRRLAIESKLYLLLNKPTGYVTTMRDPQGRPKVSDLVKSIPERVYPVGRLDFDTEGALILTNDGDFADRILHPRNEITRTYQARVKGHPVRRMIEKLRRGVEIEGRRTWPAKVRKLSVTSAESTWEVIIHEGRKRQVRLMFDAIGHPVFHLRRVAYGGLKLGSLPPGKFRILNRADLAAIEGKALATVS